MEEVESHTNDQFRARIGWVECLNRVAKSLASNKPIKEDHAHGCAAEYLFYQLQVDELVGYSGTTKISQEVWSSADFSDDDKADEKEVGKKCFPRLPFAQQSFFDLGQMVKSPRRTSTTWIGSVKRSGALIPWSIGSHIATLGNGLTSAGHPS